MSNSEFADDLKSLIQSIEFRNHSDEDFINELGKIIQVFSRNAEKNSQGMRQAVATAVDHASQTFAGVPIGTPAPNGDGRVGDLRDAMRAADRVGMN